ncbi:thioredoxin family protein [Actinoplanes sp. NEAU-H7]|uniref:Thioredoxin family protein n=2 Tax=Actinoplanes flavus TaxID=2820290 RepID=A0ABS3UEI7_9ACTN|nr:thioredoxin family protein [Actinoplanes flavus]
MRRTLLPTVLAALVLAGCGTGPSPAASVNDSSSAAPTASSPSTATSPAGPSVLLGDYDAGRDAEDDIVKALAAAGKSGRNVIVDFGADWCLDCRVLTKLSADPAVNAKLVAGFEVVSVDVGEFDRNLDVADRVGVDLESSGIPALVVLTPAGKVKVATNDGSFASARSMAAADVDAFLTRWAPAAK